MFNTNRNTTIESLADAVAHLRHAISLIEKAAPGVIEELAVAEALSSSSRSAGEWRHAPPTTNGPMYAPVIDATTFSVRLAKRVCRLGNTKPFRLLERLARRPNQCLSYESLKGDLWDGYRQGGPAGYGLRRMLIDHTHKHKGILARGEKKSLQTDRVILVRGPEEEVRVVQWIYQMFIHENHCEWEVAKIINAKGILTDLGRAWTGGTVRQVLTNEKYIGNNVYNRRSFKLKKKRVLNAPDMWVRRESAFDPIISVEDFYAVQGIIQERLRRMTDDEMLERLRGLLSKHSVLSSALIDSSEGMPASSAYRTRFGSLLKAYQLAGYHPDRDYRFLEINRAIARLYPELLENMVCQLGAAGAHVSRDPATDLFIINGEYTASMALSRCRQTATGRLRWLVQIDQTLVPDITILVRMDAANQQPADYYLLPIMDISAPKLLLCETNGAYLDTYQFDDLDYFTRMARRSKIEVTA